MEQNDKDIMNMFAKARSMKMDPDKKRQIKMSVISDTPVPSMFSWWMVMKVSSVSLVVILVVVAGVNWNSAITPVAIEPLGETAESNLLVNTATSDSTNSTMMKNSGGGLEDGESAKSAAPSMFMAQSLPEKRGVKQMGGIEYSLRGLLDGYDKNRNATIQIIARNIDEIPKHLMFNNGCPTFYVIDGVDSRNDQFCIQMITEIDLQGYEQNVWEVVVPFSEMKLGYGTHDITIGLEGYYEFSQQIVLE